MKRWAKWGWTMGLAGVALLGGTAGFSAELYSNGVGGGPWTEPASWRGKAVPGTGDVVVVATGDTIVFDGNCTNRTACCQIMIDPQAALTFKADNAPHRLSVGGSIEAYGILRMDGTKAGEQGSMELSLAGKTENDRVIRLQRGAALFTYGADRLIDGCRNVRITTSASAPGGNIFIIPETMADISRATLSNIVVHAHGVDNTGFKPTERLNIIANQFVGVARIVLWGCDTPMIRNNHFQYGGATPAVSLDACKLGQVQNNIFSGAYGSAAFFLRDTDSSFTGNTVVQANQGIHWHHGANAMIKGNVFDDCNCSAYFINVRGVMEDSTVRGSNTLIAINESTLQLTNYRLVEPRPTNTVMTLELSSMTLLNCNIKPEQIKLGQPPPDGEPWVQALAYLVVQVKGNRPPSAEITVRTAAASGGPPAGAADMNVRNSPARLGADGCTSLPRTLRPLIVRTWSIGFGGVKKDPPFYDLMVSVPGVKAGDPSQVAKTQVVEPKSDWDRPEPNKAVPTFEVTLP